MGAEEGKGWGQRKGEGGKDHQLWSWSYHLALHIRISFVTSQCQCQFCFIQEASLSVSVWPRRGKSQEEREEYNVMTGGKRRVQRDNRRKEKSTA